MNASGIKTAAYQPLARKYRPAKFSELVGQESTAQALANAIKLGREPHAVIFSGVRGIGKTTSARLYAKALNCDLGSSMEPCNTCESCQAISKGNHEDVIEIDGASNTSVDHIRSLRDTVNYVPQRSRFKVYIIDEVHMLSQSAFNALLKTLEEPPSHVVFIFATTELHKIPQTIMSRCQVFFLQKLSLAMIRDRLITILQAEGISFDDKAVTAVAREGHGSMRDALTLLDHAIAIGDGHVSMDALEKIISHVSSSPFIELLIHLIQRSGFSVIKSLDQLEERGIEMSTIAEKAAALIRHASVARDVGTEAIDFKNLGFDDEEASQLLNIANIAGPFDLNRLFRTLVKCSSELDGSVLDRFILENYCLEWCMDPGILPSLNSKPGVPREYPQPTQPPAAAHATQGKISKENIGKSLHSMLGELKTEADSSTTSSSPATAATGQSSSSGTSTIIMSKFPPSWRDLVDAWKKQKPLQARKLEDAHPIVYSAERIEILIPLNNYASATLLKPEEQKRLKEAFLELFDFKGLLLVSATESLSPDKGQEPVIPETLASIKERESIKRREQITANARNHPLTQDAMTLFNATIEDISIHDS